MGHAGIHCDHQVQTRHQGRRFGEVREMIGEIDDVGLHEQRCLVLRLQVLLQAHEGRIKVQDLRRALERQRPVVVVHVLRIARPDQANPQPVVRTEAVFPGPQTARRGRRQIRDLGWDGLKFRPESKRQAGDRAIHVERRQCRGRKSGRTRRPRRIPTTTGTTHPPPSE